MGPPSKSLSAIQRRLLDNDEEFLKQRGWERTTVVHAMLPDGPVRGIGYHPRRRKDELAYDDSTVCGQCISSGRATNWIVSRASSAIGGAMFFRHSGEVMYPQIYMIHCVVCSNPVFYQTQLRKP